MAAIDAPVDLTSPRRSSRNHASTLALDVAQTVVASLGGATDAEKAWKKTRDSSASSSSSKKHKKKKSTSSKKDDSSSSNKNKRKGGLPPHQDKRKKMRSDSDDDEDDDDRSSASRNQTPQQQQQQRQPPQEEIDPNREMTVKELIEKRLRLSGNDFSVSRLIGEEGTPSTTTVDPRLEVPDDDALPMSANCLFGDDALGRVDASMYPPACTQFNIGGTKYLPLACLMDDDGFTVSISEPVVYTMTNGKQNMCTLAEALKTSGLAVKRRILGKDLLNMLRVAGLVVHWAFVGRLSPSLLRKLQDERDKARKAWLRQHEAALASISGADASTGTVGMSSEEVVKKTVAELIQERKRRQNGGSTTPNGGVGENSNGSTSSTSGRGATLNTSFLNGSSPTASSTSLTTTPTTTAASSSGSIFPVREYRPRNPSNFGLEALARAAALRREGMTVAEAMSSSLRMPYESPTAMTNPPLKISDPDHLNKFIGLISGANDDKSESQAAQPSFAAEINCVPELTLTDKILLIADFDAGSSEETLTAKYKITPDLIAQVIRYRVPLIREQTRAYMERRSKNASSRIRALPVRRTNFVGLNIMMWRFFKDCRDRGIALTGRQLKEHAMTIANQLGLQHFKGSEGWLDAFKRRHKIDLRTMAGEAVNYESDPDGNIVCTTDVAEDYDDCSMDGMRDSDSPIGTATTDQLLASVTAVVNNEQPLMLNGDDSNGGMCGGFAPNYDDPRMAPDYRVDEASLIANIVRSTAIHVPNPEVAHALDVLRAYIVTHDPPAIGFFVDLQMRLANTISAQQMIISPCPEAINGVQEDAATRGCIDDGAVTPPMINGTASKREESVESDVSGDEDGKKENGGEEKMNESGVSEKNEHDDEEERENRRSTLDKTTEVPPAVMDSAPLSGVTTSRDTSHSSTTSEDSNDD